MKKILTVVLFFAGMVDAASYSRAGSDPNWSTLAGWRDNSTGSWAASTIPPGSSDTVTLNNGLTLSLDVDTAVSSITLVNNATDATFYMTNNNSLTLSAFTQGNGTLDGNSIVTQLNGSLLTATMVIGNVNDGSHTYNQLGGTVSASTLLRLDAGNATAEACVYNLSSGSFTTGIFQNQDTDGNSFFNFTVGSDGTFTVTQDGYNFAAFIDAGQIRQGGLLVASTDDSWLINNSVSGQTTLSVVPEPATLGMVGLGGLITLLVRRQGR